MVDGDGLSSASGADECGLMEGSSMLFMFARWSGIYKKKTADGIKTRSILMEERERSPFKNLKKKLLRSKSRRNESSQNHVI